MGLICRIYLIKEEWAKVSLTVGQFDLGLFFFGRKGCVENNEFILKYVACSIRNMHCRNNLSQQVILPLNCCDKRTMRFNKIKDVKCACSLGYGICVFAFRMDFEPGG